MVRPEAYHVTLRFLGTTRPGRARDAALAVEEAAVGCGPFRVALGRFALLGGHRPRTLVCELGEGLEDVSRLEARLRDALARRGWSPDTRPFRPHVTLARSAGSDEDVRRIVEEPGGGGIEWTVGEVVLFESRLGSGPPIYVRNAVATLAG